MSTSNIRKQEYAEKVLTFPNVLIINRSFIIS